MRTRTAVFDMQKYLRAELDAPQETVRRNAPVDRMNTDRPNTACEAESEVQPEPAAPRGAFERVMVAVDSSPQATTTIELAARLPGVTEVCLVHVVDNAANLYEGFAAPVSIVNERRLARDKGRILLVSAAERKLPVPSSLRFVAVGGGRVSAQLLERADALGLPIFEGYGLSECASVVCLNTPEQRRVGSTGQPLGHLQVKLADDGEVLVKGARMLGYLGEPAPQGEWLGTGDLGRFEDGFLVLHGRKKHQFITAYGRNVNPEWVESELVQQLPIAQAWLHGEALPGNVAVLVPRVANTPDAQLQAAVDEVNHGLPDYARVHRWLRAEAPFNASNELATANGRLRRAALFTHYQSAIHELMAEGVPA